jgi:tRNA (guanine9-N1)-methyltransferase
MESSVLHTNSKRSRKDFLCSLSPQARKKFLDQEKVEKAAQELESNRVYLSGLPLVFDLSYCSSMSGSELNSTINQIRLAVGYLRHHSQQYFKLICACVPQPIVDVLRSKGSEVWKLDLFTEDIADIGAIYAKKIVVLSPDAEDVLEDLELDNTVYVIGGLVDRTVKSSQSLLKARENNLSSARLPIKEALRGLADPFRVKKVLNINTVVEILHLKASGLSWEQCLLRSIPQRWLKK